MRNFTLCRFRLTVFTALLVAAILLLTVCGCAICKKFTKPASATPSVAASDVTTLPPSTSDTVVRGSDAVTSSAATTEVAKPIVVSETISNVVVDDTALRAAKTRIDELERKVVSLEGDVVGRDITIRSLKQTAEALTVAKPVTTLPTPMIPVNGVEVKKVDGAVRVVVPSAMIFEDGTLDKIKPSGEDVLLKVVTELESNFPNKAIAVEGYIDSMSLDPNDPSQLLNLSAYQARVVVNHLINAARVNPEHLKMAGCGAASPIADNATEEGRAKNRRIEFVVVE
jgi:flagellar motor protein MotB